MSTQYGVTPTGFVAMRLVDIQTEINGLLQATFGVGIDLSAESPLGQLVGIFAEREYLLWQLAEAVYLSAYPDTASGNSLDNAVALTGLTRKQQTYSVVTAAIFLGTNGTVIPQGSLVQVQGNTAALFALNTNVTIATPVTEVQTITFPAGTPASGTWTITWNGNTTSALAYNATASQVQAALRLLTAAVVGTAPAGLSTVTVTGSMAAGFVVTFAGTLGNQPTQTVTSSLLTAGAVAVPGVVTETTPGSVTTGNLTATTPGALAAPAGALTVIQSPLAGWSSVINPAAAVLGQVTESDAALKLRRLASLQKAGAATVPAIEAAILQVANVTACLIFENITSGTDGNGRPPKSFETVVQGGDNQAVANALWAEKPAGMQTYGQNSYNVTDSQGNTQVVLYSRPTAIPIYVSVVLQTTAAYPGGGGGAGDLAVIAQILAYGATLTLGSPVIPVPGMIAFLAGIPGITGATIYVGTAPSPSGTGNITIQQYQIATFNAANITVTP